MSFIERCALYGVSAKRTILLVLYREVSAIWGVRYRGENCVSFIERCPIYGVSAIEDKIVCPL